MGEFVRGTGTTDVNPDHDIVGEVNGKNPRGRKCGGTFRAIDNACIRGS